MLFIGLPVIARRAVYARRGNHPHWDEDCFALKQCTVAMTNNTSFLEVRIAFYAVQ